MSPSFSYKIFSYKKKTCTYLWCLCYILLCYKNLRYVRNFLQEFAKSVIYPVMVVSYEMLLRYISDVQSINFDLIICDEAHRLKNCGIKTTAVSKLVSGSLTMLSYVYRGGVFIARLERNNSLERI